VGKGILFALNIINNSRKKIVISKSPKGKYFKKPSLTMDSEISSIITTNKKSTATAPT
jgi:hypothetical protein